MHSIQPFGHHSHDEVNHFMEHSSYLLAVRPETESHENVLHYVHNAVLAEIHDGPFTVGYILDPRYPAPVQVVNTVHLEGLPKVQLGVAYIPHHEAGHHEYRHHEEHHEEHHGGLLHRFTDNVFGERHHDEEHH